jgi:hypothetical protein
MKLSAQTIGAVKFGLMIVIFSFLVFIGYALEKSIISNIREGKGSKRIASLPMHLYN